MTRVAQFILISIAGLALLTWAASDVVEATARAWFQRDIDSRAQLVLTGAAPALAGAWNNPQSLQKQLAELARDELVMGAAACDADLASRASTPGFPDEFNCLAVGSRVRATSSKGEGDQDFRSWSTVATSSHGPRSGQRDADLQIRDRNWALRFWSTISVTSSGARSGRRTFLAGLFGILAVLALGVSFCLRRGARALTGCLELRRAVARRRQAKPGVPAASQRRARTDRAHGQRARSRSRALDGGTPQTNPEPAPAWREDRDPGQPRALRSRSHRRRRHRSAASGERTGHRLEPIMRACSGVWVAHGSGSADRDTVDRHDHVRVPPDEESYHIRRVWLTDEEMQGYYYGVSNEGLWPLCHVAHARPIFRAEDWRQYRAVNQKFADAVCSEVDSKDPIILVQDYHFALAPAMIRKRLPAATVIVFWHIPWPNAERMGICPWRNELLSGLLGSSILGFHTQLHCNNFLDSVDRYLETRIDREHHAVVMQGHRTLVRPYPISTRMAGALGGDSAQHRGMPRPGLAGFGLEAECAAGRRSRPPGLHQGH